MKKKYKIKQQHIIKLEAYIKKLENGKQEDKRTNNK